MEALQNALVEFKKGASEAEATSEAEAIFESLRKEMVSMRDEAMRLHGLLQLANEMHQAEDPEAEAGSEQDDEQDSEPSPEEPSPKDAYSEQSGLQEKTIPAGYTYLGQFIDHDITFDPTSSLMRANDPNRIKNFRTPRLDLDSIYGTGPQSSPYLYRKDHPFFFLIGTGKSGKEEDLPRNDDGTALIGDPRNDENIIVSQVQLAFLKLHNRVLQQIVKQRKGKPPTDDSEDKDATPGEFKEAQRVVRWFYQYIVWNDFVKRLVDDPKAKTPLRDAVLSNKGKGSKKEGRSYQLNNRFYKWKKAPYIPVEFSVAAYRFGHCLVRPEYQLNHKVVNLPIFTLTSKPPAEQPESSAEQPTDLSGNRKLPDEHTVRWDWFLEFPSEVQVGFPLRALPISPKLSPSLARIPAGAGGTNALAFLNLRRGWRMGLPSGPDVARAMGLSTRRKYWKKMQKALDDARKHALWYYILLEGEVIGKGVRLGPVGGRIVAEVFAGLLKGDPLSYVNQDPGWKPEREVHLQPLLERAKKDQKGRDRIAEDGSTWSFPLNDGEWGFADLIALAGMPIILRDINDILAGGTPA